MYCLVNVDAQLTAPRSLDYLFQLAVEMAKLGIPWVSDIPRVGPDRP